MYNRPLFLCRLQHSHAPVMQFVVCSSHAVPSCIRMPGQGATRATQRPLSRLCSLPNRSPVPFPVASGCQDRGPPGPLNAPCPGFAPYLTVAWFLSQSPPDSWTGGHQGHSTPPVQTFQVTFPQAAQHKSPSHRQHNTKKARCPNEVRGVVSSSG